LKIWLATVGEPLPIDGEGARLLRTGQFAQWLCDQGHDVTFFSNTMDHYARKLRTKQGQTYEIAANYRIITLAGRAYRRSVSFARFRHHADVADSFRKLAPSLQQPDVIISSYPIEELCRAILDYAEPLKIPVVIDTRDLWPDIFEEVLPKPFRSFAKIAFHPLLRRARMTYSRATALSGITHSTLQWGLEKAGRARFEKDFWFPFSYPTTASSIPAEHHGVRLCFLGAISHRSNLEMFIDAWRIVERESKEHFLEICGKGEAEAELQSRAVGLNNVVFRGWLDQAQMAEVMQNSDFGLLPYNRKDFHTSLPNKYAEYLSAGLPIFSCTEGEVRQHLTKSRSGIWVEPNARAIADAILGIDVKEFPSMRKRAAEVFALEFDRNAVFSGALKNLESLVILSRL